MKFDSTIIELCSAAVCARTWAVLRYWFLYTMVGGIAAATGYYYQPAQVAQNLCVHRPGNAGVSAWSASR